MFVLQKGAECVIHRGQVQILGLLTLRLRVVHPLPPHGAFRSAFQTGEDHVGQVLLQPLDVLSGRNTEQRRDLWDSWLFRGS